MEKVSKTTCLYCAIGAVVTAIVASIALATQQTVVAWIGCAAALLCLTGIAFFVRWRSPGAKSLWVGTAAGAAVLLAVQIVAGLSMRYQPAWDLDAIYGGAIEWVESGSFSGYTEYFQYFPNNLGGLLFFAAIFRPMHALGGTNYFAAAVIANSVLVTGSVVLTVWIASRWYGTSGAVWTLAALLLCPPVWFMGAVFYTDTLSMIYPVAILAGYIRLTQTRGARQYAWAVAVGLILAAGMRIKFTVLIAFIAVCIDAVARLRRRVWLPIGVALAIAIGGYAAVGMIFYPRFLDPAEAARMNTPISHWIMMGLRGNGGYNPADYAFTRSFSDPALRNAAIRGEIRARLHALGGGGLLQMFGTKWAVCFGDGTFVLDSFLDDTPLMRSAAHEWVMRDGRYFVWYNRMAQAVWNALLVLCSVSAARGVFRARRGFPAAVAVLAVTGIALFALLWESSSRLVLNFLPMVVLAASGAWNRTAAD